MDNDMICAACSQLYQNDNPPRFLIKCGHTFCTKCIRKMIVSEKHDKKNNFKLTCPEDGQSLTLKDNNVDHFPKNKALLKIMETSKIALQFKSDLFEVSKIAKNQQSVGQLEETKDQVFTIVSSNHKSCEQNIGNGEQKSYKQQKQKTSSQTKQIQLCKFHQKPLQVVCAIDLKKICSNCAIFGQHRGHEFKSMQQIEKERIDYYHSILSIMQKKQSISQRISNEQTCNSIMEILMKKKQSMKKTINEKYHKLISTIQGKQKQSMKNLENVILKTESKLKALMKIDRSILNRYDQWQQKSYKQIKILQGNDFEAKLQLLFVGMVNEIDVLEEGDLIIEQMNKQEENLINEVEQALENIGVDFNMDIFNHVDNFVQLYDEKKKKNKTRAKTDNQITPLPINTNINNSKQPSKKIQQSHSLQINGIQDEQLKIPEKLIKSSSITGQQSLLQMLQDDEIKHIQQPKFEQMLSSLQKQISKNQSSQNLHLRHSSISQIKSQTSQKSKNQISKLKNFYQLTERNPKQISFHKQKNEKNNKKKLLTKIKIPEKFKKILDNLANDQLELVDLTNGQLGDSTIIQICQLLKGSKVKIVKLIHNKLTDQVISKILPYMKGVNSLNLSQNLLTQKTLDFAIEMGQSLKSLKNLILSQNKIVERKHKAKLDKLKSMNIHISL